MKFGLFLALLVLLASTGTFGELQERKGARRDPLNTDRTDNDDSVQPDESKPIAIVREETKPVIVKHDSNEEVEVVTKVPKSKKVKIVQKTQVDLDGNSEELESSTKKPKKTVVVSQPKDVTALPETVVAEQEQRRPTIVTTLPVKSEEQRDRVALPGSSVRPVQDVDVVRVPSSQLKDVKIDQLPVDQVTTAEEVRPVPILNRQVQNFGPLANNVLVSGSIVATQYRRMLIDSVRYEKGSDAVQPSQIDSARPRLPIASDRIAPNSYVVLYVSTVQTIDPAAAFANYSIDARSENFPLPYNIVVPLPKEQLGLLEVADVNLYFFAYISSADGRVSTFLPDGTSQILLQGTNRVVQKLQVNVKPNGIEVKGLFRARYTDRLISTGTSFQVVIVPEQSLSRLIGDSVDSVAQLVLNNLPAMYPAPFALLVAYQDLKPKINYYAVGYIFENGVQRLIKQKPVLVINQEQSLVTADVIFTVTPSPLVIRGTVTRALPGAFYFEPNSSIILSVHEKNSDSPAFTFRLQGITRLPQDIQVNLTQAPQFDASLDYEIQAIVTDELNRIYMTSSQRIPILDQTSQLIIPVDDFFYYVQVRLHSPVNEQLMYVPGSKASLIVTESPETAGTPIFDAQFDPTDPDFREYLMKIPITRAQHYRNAYLILLVNNSGIITHVSKILLISNNQPPPLRIELPVIPLNLIRGSIMDSEDRPAQWSSSSVATLYLLDNEVRSLEKAIVQTWKIHLEREFPVRFEVPLDFSLLLPGHSYSLQSTIESRPNAFEYRPANSVLVVRPDQQIGDNIRVLVKNVKKIHLVQGLIYISDVAEPLPANGEVLIQLSSSPSLLEPKIVYETRLKVDGRRLPLNFTLELPLTEIDVSSVYYFLVQYKVGQTVVVPVNQVFAFSPRNDVLVILRLTQARQVRITGQVSSTGGRLALPDNSLLHLYITDSPLGDKPHIYSEVRLQATTSALYQFTMYIDAVLLQKNISLFLRADILYQNNVILSIPRPALLQITPGGEWNINLVIDLPTLLIGQVTSIGTERTISGNFELFIQILVRGTENVLTTLRVPLSGTLPQTFRLEIDNALFVQYPELDARAVIKNCKEEVLFRSTGSVNIHSRLNMNLVLPVSLTDSRKFEESNISNALVTPVQTGQWLLSVTGVVPGTEAGIMATLDNGASPRFL